MPSHDVVRLRHVLETITLALKMANGRNRTALTSEPMLAILDSIFEYSATVSKLSDEARLRSPKSPARAQSIAVYVFHGSRLSGDL